MFVKKRRNENCQEDEEVKYWRYAVNVLLACLYIAGCVAFVAFLFLAGPLWLHDDNGAMDCKERMCLMLGSVLCILVAIGFLILPYFIVKGIKSAKSLEAPILQSLTFRLFTALALYVTVSSLMFQLDITLLGTIFA